MWTPRSRPRARAGTIYYQNLWIKVICVLAIWVILLRSMIFGHHCLYLHIRNVELQPDDQVRESPVDMTTDHACPRVFRDIHVSLFEL